MEQVKDMVFARGWTQRDFARELRVSDTTVSAWFRGTMFPRPSRIATFAQKLGVTTDQLVRMIRDRETKTHPGQ